MVRSVCRGYSLLIIIMAAFSAAGAFGGSYEDLSKVDPLLRVEALGLLGRLPPPVEKVETLAAGPLKPSQPLDLERLKRHFKEPASPLPAAPSTCSTQSREGVLYLDTFIELTPGASTEALEALGAIVGTRSADVVTADIPPDLLDDVNALSEVIRIVGSRYGQPLNDAATLETGVQTVWNTMGYRGSGALVGVVDSGLDWTHDDFKNADGSTRIVAIWDHTDEGGPAPPGYTTQGSVWTRADINNQVAREQDNDEASGGHGSHVTGSAAGDGSATGGGQPAGRFVGVANQAEILFVKTSWSEQSWGDGCAWMYSMAEAEGKPLAINLSLGHLRGPHDGSTVLEQFFDGLLDRPGRAMCIAAANSGGQEIHAYSTLAANTGDGSNLDDTPVLTFYAYPLQSPVYLAEVEFYYPAGQTIQWRPVWTDGMGNLQVGDWMGTSSEIREYFVDETMLPGIKLQAVTEIPFNDGRNLLNFGYVKVECSEAAYYINDRFFIIQMVGTGVPVHAWHTTRDQGSFVSTAVYQSHYMTPPAKLIEPDDGFTLGNPGSAGKPICVGSYVTKNQWVDVNGVTRTQEGATLGEISSFSSKGPRRDGNTTLEQQKPDVTGPGEVLVSVLSSVLAQVPQTGIERDGVHQKMQGTSMSSPVVTGLAALMLSKNPTLTNEQIKQALRNTARDAGIAGWDPTFGAGKIDAVAALNTVSTGNTPTPTVPPTATPTATETPPSGDWGDVNLDSVVDTRDAIRLLRHIEGIQLLTGQGLDNADADQSTTIDNADVDWILNRTVGN